MALFDRARVASRCAIAITILIGAVPRDARAEPPVRTWEAPAACPSSATAWAQLDALLGDAARERGAQVSIEATADARWRATIRVGDTERVLVARDCRALTAAAAVVVAVAFDPVVIADTHVEQLVETPPIPIAPPDREGRIAIDPPQEVAPIEFQPPFEPTADPIARRRRTLHHILRAGATVGWAVIPAITGGPQIGYTLGGAGWRVEAIATYAAPRTIAYADGAGGRFQSWMAGVHGCGVPGRRVSIPLCAGVEAGGVRGRGRSVVDARIPVAPALTAVATAGLVIAVRPRLSVRVGGELLIAVLRPQFHVGARDVLLSAPEVGARATAGLEWRVR